MGETHEVRQAEARRPLPAFPCDLCEQCQLAVGRGQNNDLPGRLTEVNGRVAILDPSDVADEKMHDQPVKLAAITAGSMSRRPMTTRRAGPATGSK